MFDLILAAAAAAPVAASKPEFGLLPALQQGGPVSWATFIILVIQSVGSFFILFSKYFEQQKIMNQYAKVRASFWNHNSLEEAAGKLEKDTPYRQIVDDGLRASSQHSMLIDQQDQHDWTYTVMTRTRAAIENKLRSGMSFLASVASTAPFIGLFGTVIGILAALIKISAAGQASLDTVAGPVGEALIMTAIGLAVAVPAVLAYNWLQARNKAISDQLVSFVNDVQAFMGSNGAVRPTIARAATAKPVTPAKPITAPAKA